MMDISKFRIRRESAIYLSLFAHISKHSSFDRIRQRMITRISASRIATTLLRLLSEAKITWRWGPSLHLSLRHAAILNIISKCIADYSNGIIEVYPTNEMYKRDDLREAGW